MSFSHKVIVTHAAAVTGLGATLDATWSGLLANESAIRPCTRFDTSTYCSGMSSCVDGLDVEVLDAAGTDSTSSRLCALLDILFADVPKEAVPQDAMLLTATTKAGVDNLERLQQGQACRAGDVLSLGMREQTCVRYGLRGAGYTVSAACASSTIALARSAAAISSGRAEAVLVCCADLVSEFVFSGFSALRALSDAPCKPFDAERNGLTLGEGAAALVLMSEERARREGRPCLAELVGWSAANDATHITAPARDGCGLIHAMEQALTRAKLEPEDIAGISAHGTGTVYNDLMELTATRQVFASALEKKSLPMNSIKGAIGHTMGAAGGIEAALAVRVLKERVLPGTVGFEVPEPSSQGLVRNTSQELRGACLLSCNSGFGGVNGVIILRGGAL